MLDCQGSHRQDETLVEPLEAHVIREGRNPQPYHP